MFKMKGTKRSLLMSALALLLCVSMLIGSTFAWFTDSVTSAGNIIKSGSLKISMKWADGKEKPASANWQDASTTKIFNYDKWEPGYTEARHIAVKNEGTLALKYQLTIVPTGEVSELAEVIDVYYFEDGKQIKERADLSAYTPVGTLDQLINNELSTIKVMPSGKLAAGEDFVATLVLKMQESAGNKYQGLSIGTDFSVKLIATQLTSEKDSYGPDYDKDAWMNEMQVFTPEDLQTAINLGKDPVLQANIELEKPIEIPAPAASTFSLRATPDATVIDLNGKTLSNANGYVIESLGHVVITGNGTITGMGGIRAKAGSVVIENGNFNSSSRWQDGNYQHTLKVENAVATINGGNFDATVKGHTNAVLNASTDAVITINGGNFKNVAGALTQFDPYLFTYEKNGKVIINDGTFYGGWRFNGETATTEINGGVFAVGYDGQSFHANSTHVVTVTGGTFAAGAKLTEKLADLVADGFKVVETAAGYEVISSDRNYVAAGVYTSADGNTYYITNAAGYAWMDAQADNFFGNKTIKFDADIDFGGAILTSIRFWNSHPTIDGQDHTLSNFVIGYSGSKTPSGLFEGTFNVQNLNVVNADVTGDYVGVISGQMYGNITNCSVKDSVINGTYWQTGGLAGQYNQGNVIGCVVENCVINGQSAVGGLIGILNETAGVRKVEDCAVIDCQINQTGSFGASYDKYFGVAVGLINIDNSTVYFNNCELEGNTLKGVASNALFGVAESSTKVYVDGAKLVADAASLSDALANGKDAVLTGDVKTESATTAPYGNKYAFKQDGGVLDGNGYELYMECYGDDYGIMTSGGTVKNIIIKEACRAIMIMSPTQDVILDHVQIGGDGVLYPINTGEAGADGVDLIVTNSTLAGWTSYSNIASASFTNVKFEQGTYYNNIYGRVLKPYVNTTMTDCSFVEHMNLDLSGLAKGQKVTMNNCTVNGIAVTMDVFSIPAVDAEYDTELFTVDLPSWATRVADCIVIG